MLNVKCCSTLVKYFTCVFIYDIMKIITGAHKNDQKQWCKSVSFIFKPFCWKEDLSSTITLTLSGLAQTGTKRSACWEDYFSDIWFHTIWIAFFMWLRTISMCSMANQIVPLTVHSSYFLFRLHGNETLDINISGRVYFSCLFNKMDGFTPLAWWHLPLYILLTFWMLDFYLPCHV